MRVGRVLLLMLVLVCCTMFSGSVLAQEGPTATPPVAGEETPIAAPEQVDVQPEARDDEIRQRLADILAATDWFVAHEVRVRDGVVFLQGRAETEEFKKWAGDLARNTQDVVAVVNRIQVIEPSVWDFRPALAALREQGRDVVRALPLIGFSLLILAIALGAAYVMVSATRKSLRQRVASLLLVNVIARAVGLVVFLVGLYLVFQVAGLTNVAMTILGGTGLLGLVLGIAFQDITENFLASILLSIQNPFRTGDLVEIGDTLGFVQMLTTRATVLMTQDGNHVQIPNSTVYQSVIQNYTSNPNRREIFVVGIGYEDSVAATQEISLRVLREHPAVLNDPEPWVLVDSLGASAVNLKVYFWLDGSRYSWQKVRSSVIRLVKRALQNEDIALPGEVRELVFADELPVQLLRPEDAAWGGVEARRRVSRAAEEPDTVSTDAEGGLHSDANEIEEQARFSRAPEEGDNLLEPTADS